MKKEIGKYVSEELRSLRSILNKSVEDVAKSTKINKDTIYRYERDASSIKLYILESLLNYYGISFFVFVANIDDRLQKKPQIKNKEELEKQE